MKHPGSPTSPPIAPFLPSLVHAKGGYFAVDHRAVDNPAVSGRQKKGEEEDVLEDHNC